MAIRNLVICDIDGKEGAEPHRISVDDQTVTIDLCPDCDAKLSRATEPYFAKGQVKVKAATNGTGLSETALVRSWLRAQGHPVPDKGRIPGNLQELYDAAHSEH